MFLNCHLLSKHKWKSLKRTSFALVQMSNTETLKKKKNQKRPTQHLSHIQSISINTYIFTWQITEQDKLLSWEALGFLQLSFILPHSHRADHLLHNALFVNKKRQYASPGKVSQTLYLIMYALSCALYRKLQSNIVSHLRSFSVSSCFWTKKACCLCTELVVRLPTHFM